MFLTIVSNYPSIGFHNLSPRILLFPLICPFHQYSIPLVALCYLPVAVITNYYKLVAYDKRSLFSHSSGHQSLNASKVTFPSELKGGLRSLPLSASGGCRHSLTCGHITFHVSSFSAPPFIRIHRIAFSGNPGNSEKCPHLKYL